MPPSDTESAVYSSDSDAESSHSIPPRFLLRFPDGRQERVSDGYYSNANAPQRNVRSRVTSGPVNYGHPSSHHHSRSFSLHPTTGQPQAHQRVSGHLFRPHTSNTNVRPEDIRVLPAQRSVTPGTAGYVNSRSTHRSSAQAHLPRNSVLAPTPRRAYHSNDDSSDAPHHGSSDGWVQKYGPPQPIAYSNSHPRSKYDMPTRDYSASGYRPHPSSKLSRQSVIGSPMSQTSQLTKVNTIANSHSRTLSRGIVDDTWPIVDEDEEWEKEQQRAAYRRGRTSSQSSNSPTLTHSRSRTNSSSSRSNHYAPGPKIPVSFLFSILIAGHINSSSDCRWGLLPLNLLGPASEHSFPESSEVAAIRTCQLSPLPSPPPIAFPVGTPRAARGDEHCKGYKVVFTSGEAQVNSVVHLTESYALVCQSERERKVHSIPYASACRRLTDTPPLCRIISWVFGFSHSVVSVP